MSSGSDTEHSDAELIESRSHICETELDEDETDIYFSDPEGPYMDEPLDDDDWVAEYNRGVEENERRNQGLQNRFDRIVGTKTW